MRDVPAGIVVRASGTLTRRDYDEVGCGRNPWMNTIVGLSVGPDADLRDHAGTGTGGSCVVGSAVSEKKGPPGRGAGCGSLPPWSSRNGG